MIVFTIMPVSMLRYLNVQPLIIFEDGGWLADHPLPIDKPIYGQFNELAINNKVRQPFIFCCTIPISPISLQRVIQSIMELPVPKDSHSPDARTLTKLKVRDLFPLSIGHN